MGTVSGPAGCLCTYIYIYIYIYLNLNVIIYVYTCSPTVCTYIIYIYPDEDRIWKFQSHCHFHEEFRTCPYSIYSTMAIKLQINCQYTLVAPPKNQTTHCSN